MLKALSASLLLFLLVSSLGSAYYLTGQTDKVYVKSKHQTRNIDIDIYNQHWENYLNMYISDTSHPYWSDNQQLECTDGRCFKISTQGIYYSIRVQYKDMLLSCPVSQAVYHRIHLHRHYVVRKDAICPSFAD